jgi:hypothetical protein
LSVDFIVEKRLMISLVRDNYSALGLAQHGVEINIDDLSKEEIIKYIDNENFNRLAYLKQDYLNYKNYISSEFAPSHMEYLNNDCAPELLRFMNIKIGGRKNYSYYNFLKGINERKLPIFDEQQVNFINYLSEMLPLVRQHEYQIFKCVTNGMCDLSDVERALSDYVKVYTYVEFEHALHYLQEAGFISVEGKTLEIKGVSFDEQFKDYVQDLLDYGLARYMVDFGDEISFKLWSSYRIDQVQLKLCKNPKHNQLGTYVYDGNVYIFASIKKDQNVIEHLNYKDKFLQADLFQWECQAGLDENGQQELTGSKKAYLFIRKAKAENGLTLPYTFVGTGV